MFNRKALMQTTAIREAPNDQGSTIDGDALADHAFNLGASVGEASEAAFLLMVKGKEDWEGGPFRVMFGLQNDLSSEQIAELARPGEEDGNNPDEFKVSKEDSKGKIKLVASDFYTQFARGTPAAQNMAARVEWCERAGDLKAIKDDIPADIIELAKDTHRLETHIAFLKNRIKNMPKAYRKAAELMFQFEAVKAYPGVDAEPVWAQGKSPDQIKDGELPEVENTPLNVMVWIVPEAGKPVPRVKYMTKSEFLRLNTKRAIEKGGTFNALLDTAITKKAPGGGSNSDNSDAFVIKTVDKGIAVLAEFHRWSEEIGSAKDKADIGKLYKLMNTKDNDELIVAMCETAAFLNAVISETSAGQKYIKLQQGGSELVKEATKTAA